MTQDNKVRYGMMALTGASVVFATLGVHIPVGTHISLNEGAVGGWGL